MLIQLPLSSGPQAQTSVIVGIYQNEPLVFTDAEGIAKGIYPEILNYIARIEGWEFEYLEDTWTALIDRLEIGTIDLLVAIAYSEERSKKYDFSRQALVTNWAQIYTPKQKRIRTLLDLRGKKLAVAKEDI
jgi:ABC-type amino acid transport substrate-binding protein